MADMSFKETCPCGNNIEVSGYVQSVEHQIIKWRVTHNKHANYIVRAIAEARAELEKYPLIAANGSALVSPNKED